MQGVRGAHLRIARPSDDLEAVAFYRDGLGFEVLGSFKAHARFDGDMLGHCRTGYHPGLIHEPGHKVGRPNAEHLLAGRSLHSRPTRQLATAKT